MSSQATTADPTGRYKGTNFDPHYREKRQAERERPLGQDRGPPYPPREGSPRRHSGGPPPTRGYDHPHPSTQSQGGGRPPWEEREHRDRERPYERDMGPPGSVPTGRPPWEEREREGNYKRSPRDTQHLALRESYIPPVRRNGDDYAHGQSTRPSRYDSNPTHLNGDRAAETRDVNGEHSDSHLHPHTQPSRAYSPSAPTDSIRSVGLQPNNQNQSLSLTSQNLASILTIGKTEEADEIEQTLSESGVENSLDSLAKLQQFKAEVEASRTRRATTELEPNKLTLMAESFLLAQQAPEPGEVIEDAGGDSSVPVTDEQRLAEAKNREQDLKERLLKARLAESNGQNQSQTNGGISNSNVNPATQVKREREDDPVHAKQDYKRPKAEDIAMNDTRRPIEQKRDGDGHGKGGPNYRPSERNFVPERFKGASHEEVQRRAAASSAVAAREPPPREAVRRRSNDRGYHDGRAPVKDAPPPEGRSLLHRISGGPGHRARSGSPKPYRRPSSPTRGPGYGRPPSPGRTLDSRIGGRYAPPPPGPAAAYGGYPASPPRRPRDLPPPASRAPEPAYDRAPPREYERERPKIDDRREPAYPNARDDRYPERYQAESRVAYRPAAEPTYAARAPPPAAPVQAPIAVTSMVTTLAALKAQIALLESQIPVTPAPSAPAPPPPAPSHYPPNDRYGYDNRPQDRERERERERGRPPPPPQAAFDSRERVRPASPLPPRYSNGPERYPASGPGPSREYEERSIKAREYDDAHQYSRDRVPPPPPPGPTYEDMHAGDRYGERRYEEDYRRGDGPDRGRGRGRGRGGGGPPGRGGYR